MLSDIDDEVSGPIAYFDDFTEAVPNTPFAAILAKETIKGKAIARTGGWAGNKIGVAGSQGVREVRLGLKLAYLYFFIHINIIHR